MVATEATEATEATPTPITRMDLETTVTLTAIVATGPATQTKALPKALIEDLMFM